MTVQLWPWAVDRLIELNYLQPTERNGLEAVKAAASEFFSDALCCWDGYVGVRR